MKMRWALLWVIGLLGLLVGCGLPVATRTPVAIPGLDRASAEARTLASLQKLDDHPLYTMRYEGAYLAQAGAMAGQGWLPRWGCTLFAALGDPQGVLRDPQGVLRDPGGMVYGRNFDWEPSPALLLFTAPPGGYPSVAMVDIAYLGFRGERAGRLLELSQAEQRALLRAPWLPFDGMNARGLAVGMAAVPSAGLPLNPARPTLDSLEVIRKILDEAATVDEAVAILRGHNIAWGSGPPLHYLVADRQGQAAVVEFFAGEARVLPNTRAWHAATNFTLSEVGENRTGRCWRYDLVTRQLEESRGRLSTAAALDLLGRAAQKDTQWSVVYGLQSGEVTLALGRKYGSPHTLRLSNP